MRSGASVVRNGANALRSGLSQLDRLTSPQPHTHGDFDRAPYLPAGSVAFIEGLALRGPMAAVTSTACALTAVFVESKTGSTLAAVASSAGTAVALTMAMNPTLNATTAKQIVLASALGAYQGYRSNRTANVRAADSFGALVAGPFVAGPAKVVAGVASATIEKLAPQQAAWRKALLGAGLGAGLGVLAVLGGAVSGTPLVAIVLCGCGGAVGPLAGPRYSQSYRNVSQAVGKQVERGLQRAHVLRDSLPPRVRNCLGTIPSGALKEGVTGLVFADGHLLGLAAGAVMEAVHETFVFLFMGAPKTPAEQQPASNPPPRS